jgi:hypothetical protein
LTGTVPTWNQSTTGNAATATSLTSTLALSAGGTGQTTAILALNALLPSQASQGAKVLGTDGTNATWVASGGGSVNGVTPAIQIIVPSSNKGLPSQTAASNVFNTPYDEISLSASTTYMFDGQYLLQHGTVSHYVKMNFSVSAGTFTSLTWSAVGGRPTSLSLGAQPAYSAYFTNFNGGQVTVTSVSANSVIRFQGVMRVNQAVLMNPQISFSAAPTSACNCIVGSYLRFYPIGSNTMNSIGTGIT